MSSFESFSPPVLVVVGIQGATLIATSPAHNLKLLWGIDFLAVRLSLRLYLVTIVVWPLLIDFISFYLISKPESSDERGRRSNIIG